MRNVFHTYLYKLYMNIKITEKMKLVKNSLIIYFTFVQIFMMIVQGNNVKMKKNIFVYIS